MASVTHELMDRMSGTTARLLRLCAACLLGLASLNVVADAGALRAKHNELREQLRNNSFQRAMHIDSSEAGDTLKGDVYAVLEHPFGVVGDALKNPSDWCDILILPFNTKYCHAVNSNGAAALQRRIDRKYDQPVEKAFRLDFALRPQAATSDYFESRLEAQTGPLGTKDYRIAVSAIPLDGGRTFMNLSYSYGYGMAGRMAMQAYLATAGSGKVGFTVTGKDGKGQPIYIGGMRGATERNAMRYYLAIDAYLGSLRSPSDQKVEKRIQTWFDATERYPRQLHELGQTEYLEMKRREYRRQS